MSGARPFAMLAPCLPGVRGRLARGGRRCRLAALAVLLSGVARLAAAQTGRDSAGGSAAAATGFALRAGDVIGIRIWPDSSLSGEFPIEESGLVYLPGLGPVQAAGVPLAELRADLRRRYALSMRTPVISITPHFRVSVLGAVQRPGLYQITPANTLYDVIGLAGGFQANAREDRLRVVREGQVFEINAQRTLESGEALAGLELHSGDQIVVPPRPAPFLTFQSATFALQAIVLVLTIFRIR